MARMSFGATAQMFKAAALCKKYKPYYKEIRLTNVQDPTMPWSLEVTTKYEQDVRRQSCRTLRDVEEQLKDWKGTQQLKGTP